MDLYDCFGLSEATESTIEAVGITKIPLTQVRAFLDSQPSCDSVAEKYTEYRWTKGLRIGFVMSTGKNQYLKCIKKVVGFVRNDTTLQPESFRRIKAKIGQKSCSCKTLLLIVRMMRLDLDIPSNAAIVFQDENLVVETPESRQKLIASIKTRLEKIGPRKIPEICLNGSKIKGHYRICEGHIYGKNDKRLKYQSNGRVCVACQDDSIVSIHIGRLAAYTYPEIYNTSDGRHIDHINGDYNDNRLCNIRMVTNDQNQMVRDTTKETRPKCFKNSSQHCTDIPCTVSKKEMEIMVNSGSVKVYNSRWFHKDGVVWRQEKNKFVHVQLTINRNGYLVYGYKKKNYQAHIEIMKAFGIECPPGCDRINHIDRNKQNFALCNLEWTDRSGNCATRKPCLITWKDGTKIQCASLTEAYHLLQNNNKSYSDKIYRIQNHIARNQGYIDTNLSISLVAGTS